MAVFIGKHGLGKWQEREINAFFPLSVQEGRPIIPVRLEGYSEELPPFLNAPMWIDFNKYESVEALLRLIWGITGKKPLDESNREWKDPGRSSSCEVECGADGRFSQREVSDSSKKSQ